MNYEQKTKNYFEFFSKKDVSGLESLFSNNIVLRDWEIHAIGKHDVINSNSKIFESVNTIKVRPKIIYCVNKYQEIIIFWLGLNIQVDISKFL